MYFRRHIPCGSRYLLKPHLSATCMTKLLRFGFEIGIPSAPITQKLKATTGTDENKLVISLAHRLRGARQTTCAVHRKLVESLPMTGSNQDSALNKFDVLPAPFALRNFVSQIRLRYIGGEPLNEAQLWILSHSVARDARQANGIAGTDSEIYVARAIDPFLPSRTCPSTNRRIADDRFVCSRVLSISVSVCAKVAPCAWAISFRILQNCSSRLMVVLCPPMTTERLITDDFTVASSSKRILG